MTIVRQKMPELNEMTVEVKGDTVVSNYWRAASVEHRGVSLPPDIQIIVKTYASARAAEAAIAADLKTMAIIPEGVARDGITLYRWAFDGALAAQIGRYVVFIYPLKDAEELAARALEIVRREILND